MNNLSQHNIIERTAHFDGGPMDGSADDVEYGESASPSRLGLKSDLMKLISSYSNRRETGIIVCLREVLIWSHKVVRSNSPR